MDVEKIREDFPILKKIIYFDNAATSLTPKQVLAAMDEYYMEYRANIHRGLHYLSEVATKKYEGAHAEIAKFFGAQNEEIFITRNTTESINQLAFSLFNSGFLKSGDKIVTTLIEHHSNFLPWLRLAKKHGIKIEIVRPAQDGVFDFGSFERACKGAKLLTFVHVSNVLGSIANARELCKIAHENGALTHVDAAQSAPHLQINVKEIGCDFLSCSSHKMCGPTGVGALYMKKEFGDKIEPALLGGGAINKVTTNDYTLTRLPDRWEAGTPDIGGVIGFGQAVKYLSAIGMKNIEKCERKLSEKMFGVLSNIPKLELYGPRDLEKRSCVFAFNFSGLHPHDVAGILSNSNIAVRSGHHCAMPLHTDLLRKPEGTCRASLYFYNTAEEIERFGEVLKDISKLAS